MCNASEFSRKNQKKRIELSKFAQKTFAIGANIVKIHGRITHL